MSQIETKDRNGSRFEVYGVWLHNEMGDTPKAGGRVEGGIFRLQTVAKTPQNAIDWVTRTMGVDVRVMGVTQQ